MLSFFFLLWVTVGLDFFFVACGIQHVYIYLLDEFICPIILFQIVLAIFFFLNIAMRVDRLFFFFLSKPPPKRDNDMRDETIYLCSIWNYNKQAVIRENIVRSFIYLFFFCYQQEKLLFTCCFYLLLARKWQTFWCKGTPQTIKTIKMYLVLGT